MNNNILLLAILVVLINFSFYLKMGKLNRYLLLSGLAVISGAVLYSGVREGFQEAGEAAAAGEGTGGTGEGTGGTGAGETITIIALKPEESKKLSIVAGKTQVLSLLDTLEMKHLSDLNTVLRTVAENSSTMYSVQQDLGLIVEILEQFIMRNTQRETTPVSETIEYSALRDNLAYVFQGYAEKELAVLEKMRNIFSLMYNIVPIENKGSLVSSYLFEVNKRLLAKQKEEEMKRREEMYEQQQEETSPQEPARDPLVAEERLNAFLQDKTPEKFEELFGKIEPQDMVYNVGVPVEDYMKQIIRPQDWSRALRPPSCIRDSTQLVEPVAILDQGIPSNVHEFRGVGTILPKFAYTEVYDPKFY